MFYVICLVVVGAPALLSPSETGEALADSRTISTPDLNLQGWQARYRSPLPYRKNWERLHGAGPSGFLVLRPRPRPSSSDSDSVCFEDDRNAVAFEDESNTGRIIQISSALAASCGVAASRMVVATIK